MSRLLSTLWEMILASNILSMPIDKMWCRIRMGWLLVVLWCLHLLLHSKGVGVGKMVTRKWCKIWSR